MISYDGFRSLVFSSCALKLVSMHSKNPHNRLQRAAAAQRIEQTIKSASWDLPSAKVYPVSKTCPVSNFASPPPLLARPIDCVSQTTLEAVLEDRLASMSSSEAFSPHPPSAQLGVLVFGSATRPGGGWRSGAKAQEEDVALHSTWGIQAEQAPPGFYVRDKGLGPHAILQADGFWLEDSHGFPLGSPLPCSFISIAAPNRQIPAVASMPYPQLQQLVYDRLMLAMDVWQKQKLSTVVLGALGCGVFEWSPEKMAQVMARVLHDTSFQGQVKLALPDPIIKDVFEKILSLSSFSPAPRRPS